MYSEQFLKGKKILIVSSAEKNLRENPHLSCIKSPPPEKNYSIKKAFDYLGIEADYVIDYESAIEKLIENNNGYCNYYACLVLSGEPYLELHRKDFQKTKPELLGEFLRVIIEFWKNGGGLNLFSDNTPFTFHSNLILQKLFNGSIKNRWFS